jgi:hypothetical protein
VDTSELRRIIDTANAVDIGVPPSVTAAMKAIAETWAERDQIGDDALSAHSRMVAKEVAERLANGKSGRFTETWDAGISAMNLAAWKAWRSALDQATSMVANEALAAIKPQVGDAWQATIEAVLESYSALGGDCSVERALLHPDEATAGLEAVSRLRSLADLVDLILRTTTRGQAAWLGRDYALSPEHGIDWTMDLLPLLGAVGDIISTTEVPDDPFQARYQHLQPAPAA